ncbi:hypothetical protein [Vibrio mediterranei]|uniref:hypothetical protein n=1 Tax=Vibrio mediterranei TaxID=689 RepID=UPI004068DC97
MSKSLINMDKWLSISIVLMIVSLFGLLAAAMLEAPTVICYITFAIAVPSITAFIFLMSVDVMRQEH